MRFTAAVRAHWTDDPDVNDPRQYLAPARDAVSDAVAATITAITVIQSSPTSTTWTWTPAAAIRDN